MSFSDKLAFMPLRYLLPLVWITVILATSVFSYLFVQDELHKGVKKEILERVSQRFSHANSNLALALSIGTKEEDLKNTQNSFEVSNNTELITGYINKDKGAVLLSAMDKDKGLFEYLTKDFDNKQTLLSLVYENLCELEHDEYIVWVNNDIFYIFRALGDGCNGEIHFLRYSLSKERDERVHQMLNVIFFYTMTLIGVVFVIGVFSYYVMNIRLGLLLDRIMGYTQGMSNQRKPMGGRDEFSEISKAFSAMSHKMSAVLDDMYTFVALLNPRGQIVFVNNTPLQASALNFCDVEGKRLSDTYWWDYDDITYHEIDALIQRCIQGEIINEETQIQIADGKMIWINFCMHPVYDSDGKIEHLVAEGVDISGQKQAFEDLLRQSRKAKMGEMISVIAHQWRQPLGLISAVTGKVILDNELNLTNTKDLNHAMNKINDTVMHLGSTMTQFTNFFNPNKKAQETSFNIIVTKCMNIIGSKLKSEHIEIEVQFEEVYPMQSFEEELMQVIMDMMKNSADFFKINNITNPKIILRQYLQDNNVCLSIEDNAGGIKDEDMQDLFKPYFSTKPQEGGTGLGLHMSKMIVEDHCGGKIEVNQLDKGAKFIICLPVS